MASIRKRVWTADGVQKEAWVVDYKDAGGRRRLKTCPNRKSAEFFAKAVGVVGAHMPETIARSGAFEFVAPLPIGRRQQGRIAIADAFRSKYPSAAPTTGTVGVQVFAEVPPVIAVADVDNLLKPVLDALTGVAWFDDTQVSELLVRRFPGRERRLFIKIWSVPTEMLVRGLPTNSSN